MNIIRENKRTIIINGNHYAFNAHDQLVEVQTPGRLWKQNSEFQTNISFLINDEIVCVNFADAQNVKTEVYCTGTAFGLKTTYENWAIPEHNIQCCLETIVWVHRTTGHLYFEIYPVFETTQIKQIKWPAPWVWDELNDESYSVFPMMQGVLIPSNWETEFEQIGDPVYCAMGAFMPWFGQISNKEGYIQIAVTPHDCGNNLAHPAGGPTTFNFNWLPSLGYLTSRRTIRTEFFSNCDYNTLCKAYRKYIKNQGKLITLKQKEAANPLVSKLHGSPVIHSHIYFYIKPEAAIYKKGDDAHNYRFATFEERAKQIEALAAKGLRSAYFHLDGWGVDGYDQQHPDYLPPCEKAGGEEGMRLLAKVCRENNVLFALHDQYRDYYLDARSFDSGNSVLNTKNENPRECTWNGGEQQYLCASLAGQYIERNYEMLEDMGLKPDGVYLDVFAATHPDECLYPAHKMTRTQCVEYRGACLEYMRANGIIVSSEDAVDTMMPHMDLVHHAPYANTYAESTRMGVSVPLTDLVYHDCLVTPWAIIGYAGDDQVVNTRMFLEALLNGGIPYLPIDAEDTELNRAKIVCDFNLKVAGKEMLKHEFLNESRSKQKTTFEGGISVTVDFESLTYNFEGI